MAWSFRIWNKLRHGSGKWVPPIFVSFDFRSDFPLFHEYWRKGTYPPWNYYIATEIFNGWVRWSSEFAFGDGLFSKAMLCFRECKMWEVDSFDEASFMSHLRSFTVPILHTRGWFSQLSLFDSRVAPASHRWTAVNLERSGVTRFEELRIATVFAGFGACRTWAGRKTLFGNASLTSCYCRHLTYVTNVEHTTFMITVNGCRGLSHSQKPIDSEDDVTLTQKKTQLTFGEFQMQITNRSLFLRSATLKWTPMALLKQMLLVNNCRLRTCSMWLEKRGSLASGGLKFCCSLRCCSDVFWPGEIPHGSGGL